MNQTPTTNSERQTTKTNLVPRFAGAILLGAVIGCAATLAALNRYTYTKAGPDDTWIMMHDRWTANDYVYIPNQANWYPITVRPRK